MSKAMMSIIHLGATLLEEEDWNSKDHLIEVKSKIMIINVIFQGCFEMVY